MARMVVVFAVTWSPVRAPWLTIIAVATTIAPLVGCPTWPEPVLCGQIPADGCPVGRGGTCSDTACAALYDCVDGHWTRTETCSGGGGGGAAGTGGAHGGQGPCTPVVIDTTGQVTGCTPDLQPPDCPVEAVLGCAESVCLTGCVDFFLCTEELTDAGPDKVWSAVAYCDEVTGKLVVGP
jgi:hypothetical protein